MTPLQYTTALATLGLSQADAACAWLGVTRSTHYRYAQQGPTEPVARLITLAVRLRGLERLDWGYDGAMDPWPNGDYVRHADVADALGVPGRLDPPCGTDMVAVEQGGSDEKTGGD